jgi:hypothetical protein
VKLAILALLILPSLASADDTVPNVGDIHVGVAAIGFGGDADVASGAGIFADGEAGWRVGAFDLTGFGAYATRHVDDTFDNGNGNQDEHGHYRVHVIDLGLRATWRGKYTYGGIGVAFENELESGMIHTPSVDVPVNNSDQHVAGEVRVGVIVRHVDVSAAFSFASMYDEPFGMYRMGVGYRF